jgi:Ca-activated chloride channel homolog
MIARRNLWPLVAPTLIGQPGATFSSKTRLVEVFASIVDGNGRFVAGLTRERFELLDNKSRVEIRTFEDSGEGASGLTCAILLDTTDSMNAQLPFVKNSINRLIGQLGEKDQVGVFGFANMVRSLQDYTLDKKAAMNAVLRVRASGGTALFDALSQVARELSERPGRKAIVAVTDGVDNSSILNGPSATQRAKKAGVPIYIIRQGAALSEKNFSQHLSEISKSTGGKAYSAGSRKEFEQAFSDIFRDFKNTYLLTFTPLVEKDPNWRTIQLNVSGLKDYKVRAKEGYYLD